MKLKEKLRELSDNAKMFLLLLVMCFVGALIFIPLCATQLLSWGWEIGFLFGSVIDAIALLLIIISSTIMTNNISSVKALIVTISFFILRIALYVGALVLAAFFQYKWNLESVMNLFGVFIGLLPMQIAVAIVMYFKKEEAKHDIKQ